MSRCSSDASYMRRKDGVGGVGSDDLSLGSVAKNRVYNWRQFDSFDHIAQNSVNIAAYVEGRVDDFLIYALADSL